MKQKLNGVMRKHIMITDDNKLVLINPPSTDEKIKAIDNDRTDLEIRIHSIFFVYNVYAYLYELQKLVDDIQSFIDQHK